LQGLSGAWKQTKTNAEDFGVQLGRNFSNSVGLEAITRSLAVAFGFWADKLRVVGAETGKANLASERHVHSMKEEKDAAEDLKKQIEVLRDAYHKTTEELALIKTAYDRLDAAQGQTDNSKKQKELALLRDQEARKLITVEQSLIAKAKIEEKYERMEEQRRERAIQRDMALKDAELNASMAQEQLLRGQIAQAQSHQTTQAAADAQRAKAENAKSGLQNLERESDELNKKLHPKNPLDEPVAAQRDEIESRLMQVEYEKKKAKQLAEAEAAKVSPMQDQARNDEKKIEQLKELQLRQEQETMKRRLEAFNAANIGSGEINQLRNQRHENATTRILGLGTDIYQHEAGHGGGAALTPAEAERIHREIRLQILGQIATAFANHESPETIAQLTGVYRSAGGTAAEYQSLIGRATANVRLGAGRIITHPEPSHGPSGPVGSPTISGAPSSAPAGDGLHIQLGNAPRGANGAPSISGVDSSGSPGGLTIHLGGAGAGGNGRPSISGFDTVGPEAAFRQITEELNKALKKRDDAVTNGLRGIVVNLNTRIDELQTQIAEARRR
jgi:hypothetical protein